MRVVNNTDLYAAVRSCAFGLLEKVSTNNPKAALEIAAEHAKQHGVDVVAFTVASGLFNWDRIASIKVKKEEFDPSKLDHYTL